jgi:hypothetical protein
MTSETVILFHHCKIIIVNNVIQRLYLYIKPEKPKNTAIKNNNLKIIVTIYLCYFQIIFNDFRTTIGLNWLKNES